MKRIILVFLFILSLFTLFADQPLKIHLTKDEADYLQKLGEVTMCVDPDWPPFELVDEEGNFTGIAADLLNLISERAGIDFKLVPTADWDETLAFSRAGKCHIIPFLNQTKQREQWLTFTDPLFTDSNVFITRVEHPFISDPAELIDKTVVLPSGTSIEEFIKRDFPNLTVINTETELEALLAVLNNEADMTLRSLTVSAYTIRKEGFFNLKISGQVPEYKNNLRIGVLKEEQMLRQILNKGIAAITPRDRDIILNRHVNIKIETPMDYYLILQIAAVISFIGAVVFYWIFKLRTLNRRLGESEERTRLLSEVTLEGIVIHNGGVPVDVNRALLQITGYSRDELVGFNFIQKVIHPDYRDTVAGKMGLPYTGAYEVKIIRKDDSQIFVEIEAYSFQWQGKGYRVAAIRDIDEKRKTDQALRESEEKLRAIFDIANIGVSITDNNGKYVIFNKWWCDYLGYSEEEMMNKSNIDITHPEDITLSRNYFARVLSGEIDKYRFEKRFVRKDGTVVWSDLSVSAVKDKDGNVALMVGMINDITEKKQMERDLLKAKEKAEEASRSKSEFLANMSHELRTPLNGVIGFSDLLVKSLLNDAEREFAENINNSARSLLGVINDILDFSKIESGKMELDIIKSDVAQICRESLGIIRFQAAEKSLNLILTISDDVPGFACVDPLRLKQILVNLLGNAVKFTPSGEIELKVLFREIDSRRGIFTYSVRDTGIGIGPREQEKLFKAFSQADSSTTRKFGGTGLGLVISSMLADKMGSRIELESEPGRGSVFFFSLESEYDIKGADTRKRKDIAAEESKPEPAVSINLKPLILVAEDEPMSRLLIKTILKQLIPDARVIETVNGLEALAAYKKEKPYFFLLDVHMPEMDGLEVTRNIRNLENDRGGHVPIIALSAGVIKEEQDTCIEAGMDGFLAKPVDRGALKKILSGYLGFPDRNS